MLNVPSGRCDAPTNAGIGNVSTLDEQRKHHMGLISLCATFDSWACDFEDYAARANSEPLPWKGEEFDYREKLALW